MQGDKDDLDTIKNYIQFKGIDIELVSLIERTARFTKSKAMFIINKQKFTLKDILKIPEKER